MVGSGSGASNTPSAAPGLALGFEIEQLAGDALGIDLVTAIGNGLLQPGDTLFIHARQVAQPVTGLLQLLRFAAELYGCAVFRSGRPGFSTLGRILRCVADGFVTRAALYIAGTSAVGGAAGIVQPVEIDNHGVNL